MEICGCVCVGSWALARGLSGSLARFLFRSFARWLVNHEAIAAAKGGIEAMVRSAAATYARRGLRINAVAPGLTDTKMASRILASDAMRDAASQKIPTQRINQKEEAASAMHWLLTDAPDNMTGQVLHLDGGMANALV